MEIYFFNYFEYIDKFSAYIVILEKEEKLNVILEIKDNALFNHFSQN